MKILSTFLLVAALAPSAHAEINILDLYNRTLECKGIDALSGHEISFEMIEANYDGRHYSTMRLQKIALGNEKIADVNLLSAGNYSFKQKDENFALSLATASRSIEAKGTCEDTQNLSN